MLSNSNTRRGDFVFNIIILIFLNLLVKPFWILGIDVAVQNRVGTTDYGLYFAIFNFTYIFNAVLDMGICNFNNRNIARYPHLLSKHIGGIIGLKLLLSLLYFLLVIIVAWGMGYSSVHFKLLLWMAINQMLNSFILYLRSNVSALLYFKTDSFLSVCDKLLMILICSLLLWTPMADKFPFRIEYFVYAQTAAYTLTALIALTIVKRCTTLTRIRWDLPFFLLILKKSFPFALLTLLMALYNRIDSVMIERLLPNSIAASQAGIYASAFRLLDALAMISYLFSIILLPLFSKMLKNREKIDNVLQQSFSLLWIFAIAASIILIIYRTPILSLLYDSHVGESAEVFKVLILCIIPISLTYIFGTLLTAAGSMRLLNISATIGITTNLLINLLLIPRWGAYGAAIASLSTQSLMALLQMGIAIHTLQLSWRSIPLLRALLFAAVVGVSTYGFANSVETSLGLSLVICAGWALLMAWATQLFSFRWLKSNRDNPLTTLDK